MAQYMSMDTLKFLLFDVQQFKDLLKFDRFADFDESSADIILDSAKSLSDQYFYPYFREMDEQPAYFKDGKVHSHPIVKTVFEQAGANGWIGAYFDSEDGGSQMPYLLNNAANHILEAANNHLPGYLGLTSGSAHLIASFGTPALKDRFIPNMVAGKWGGTMALTEPQSGSSLSDITTSAQPTADGHYLIKGQKIFISGGDHEGVENFIHLTLARITGAPEGTKGISLFVVPKYRPHEDGSLEYNDVCAVADFQKMGQRGYSTVHLVYGEQNDCHGYLVGELNQGLKYMFQMMNGARIDVGMTATSTATAAYYASLQYAKERSQGKRLLNSDKKEDQSEQTLIINHPDVRRMLMLQKSIVEASLSLLLECSKLADIVHCETGEKKENAHLLLELLTPIAKTYPSEMGRISINNGLQILGGYGFCMDFPLQQYLRDIRIMAIYEGTTGIQSLDLLGRKIPAQNGKALVLLMKDMSASIAIAKEMEQLIVYANQLEAKMGEIQQVLAYLTSYAMKGDYEFYLADATIFMEMAANIVIAYQWLKIGIEAQKALDSTHPKFDKLFYESKIETLKFYFKYELPKTKACLETILNPDKLTIMDDEKEIIF